MERGGAEAEAEAVRSSGGGAVSGARVGGEATARPSQAGSQRLVTHLLGSRRRTAAAAAAAATAAAIDAELLLNELEAV